MSALNSTFSSNATGVTAKQQQSAEQFAASFVTAIVVFVVQVGIFLLLKDRFARIYQPRTYLVPERERTKPAPPGWFKWIKPILKTSNSEFVHRCGLDAYFFLRYLRTLLKIFVPAACVILPVLLPLNSVHGKGGNWAVGQHASQSNVTGLDTLAWGNVRPTNTNRYWAHWLLALGLIVWICYVSYDELKNYIRMRQAYMTSPQHRLRASATTVLVSSIPPKWCTVEALDGLYDVFPGGLRNIWINRNFDELSDKVKKRDKLAKTLENTETALIKKCFKKNEENMAKAEKEAGKKITKEEKAKQKSSKDQAGRQQAHGHGISTGNPHQVQHTVEEATGGDHESISSESDHEEDAADNTKRTLPGGVQAFTQGFDRVKRGFLGGIRGANNGVNKTIDTTNGFVAPQDDPTRESEDTVNQHLVSKPLPDTPRKRNTKQFGTERHSGVHDASAGAGNTAGRGRSTNAAGEKAAQGSPLSQSSTVRSEKGQPGSSGVQYPTAFEEGLTQDPDDALWREYLTEKDRDTMRLPIFGWQWMPTLPLMGPKVDTIRYCREQVATLNTEIEEDQAHPERFPLMNSAFIQFNHQVAAHMACQSLSHHVPKQMAPRLIEIDPNDVIWDNMSIPWWQRYIRTAAVVVIVVAMIVLWAIPVAFTSALSQINTAAHTYTWLSWLLQTPAWFRSVLQGVLPAALLGLLLFLLPVILRALIKLEGAQSGMLIELSVQSYYFFFLFVQLFLVVTIAGSALVFASYFTSADGFTKIPDLLGQSIPQASNYFISYMLLQALSVSAGALLQVGSLFGWFILAPILDTTARAKFRRQTNLSNIQWGTFFPTYTNLACIGLIYSVISPLILIFNIITFSLFWFVYRFNTLFVTRFTRDTGGLLYPNAINYTFVGVYMMEIGLIGMFFLVRDENDNVACSGQAIGMIIILILTAGYQFLLNRAFSPLFRYLPITLEDDAVRRDEEFARAMQKRNGVYDDDEEGQDLEDQLEARERQEMAENDQLEEYELQQIQKEKDRRLQRQKTQELPELEPYEFQNPEINMDLDQDSRGVRLVKMAAKKTADNTINKVVTLQPSDRKDHRSSWADRGNNRNHRASNFGGYASDSPSRVRSDSYSVRNEHQQDHHTRRKSPPRKVLDRINNLNPIMGNEKDVEAQRAARNQLADALFAGVNDELEDLTPEQRDTLVQRAFQHTALRARRPVIWLPRDELGVSDDEVRRMGRFSNNLWVSNVRQGLDSKGRCVYSGAPPDFSEIDLIQL